jgi:hypothetical protein
MGVPHFIIPKEKRKRFSHPEESLTIPGHKSNIQRIIKRGQSNAHETQLRLPTDRNKVAKNLGGQTGL